MNPNSDPAAGLLSLDKAVAWRNELRRQGKRLVVTNGCFDIMHRGHDFYLHEARQLGDALLILINSDAPPRALKGESRPIICEGDRAYMLNSLAAVDCVVLFDGSRCHRELAALNPDIYVKGGDYTIDKLDPGERAALLDGGTEIVFKPFVPGLSTTTIIDRIKKLG